MVLQQEFLSSQQEVNVVRETGAVTPLVGDTVEPPYREDCARCQAWSRCALRSKSESFPSSAVWKPVNVVLMMDFIYSALEPTGSTCLEYIQSTKTQNFKLRQEDRRRRREAAAV